LSVSWFAHTSECVPLRDRFAILEGTQLRDICLAAARIFGWKGDSVSVAVNADKATVVVCTEEKRAELQERLRRLQEAQAAEEQAAAGDGRREPHKLSYRRT
jgi:hypothetical protein